MIINLFFDDWLKENNVQYGEITDFEKWQKVISEKLKREVQLSTEMQGQLKFHQWINNYLKGTSDISSLDKLAISWQKLSQFAEILSKEKNYTKAIEIMDYAVKKFPIFGQVYYFRGEIYRKMNKFESAKEDYKTCLAKYSGYPFAEEKLKKMSEN